MRNSFWLILFLASFANARNIQKSLEVTLSETTSTDGDNKNKMTDQEPQAIASHRQKRQEQEDNYENFETLLQSITDPEIQLNGKSSHKKSKQQLPENRENSIETDSPNAPTPRKFSFRPLLPESDPGTPEDGCQICCADNEPSPCRTCCGHTPLLSSKALKSAAG